MGISNNQLKASGHAVVLGIFEKHVRRFASHCGIQILQGSAYVHMPDGERWKNGTWYDLDDCPVPDFLCDVTDVCAQLGDESWIRWVGQGDGFTEEKFLQRMLLISRVLDHLLTIMKNELLS